MGFWGFGVDGGEDLFKEEGGGVVEDDRDDRETEVDLHVHMRVRGRIRQEEKARTKRSSRFASKSFRRSVVPPRELNFRKAGFD